MTDLERANAAVQRQIKILAEAREKAGIELFTVSDMILLGGVKTEAEGER